MHTIQLSAEALRFPTNNGASTACKGSTRKNKHRSRSVAPTATPWLRNTVIFVANASGSATTLAWGRRMALRVLRGSTRSGAFVLHGVRWCHLNGFWAILSDNGQYFGHPVLGHVKIKAVASDLSAVDLLRSTVPANGARSISYKPARFRRCCIALDSSLGLRSRTSSTYQEEHQ